MKTLKPFALFVLAFHISVLYSQTAAITGNVFLENKTNHDSIFVHFKRVAPSVLYDTSYTNTAGAFSNNVVQGIYNIYYSKPGFISDSIIGVPLYNTTTLPNDTLEEVGLCGQLSGTLLKGIYKVGCNIQVASGDTLIINPGVKLMFENQTEFIIDGLLIAQGNSVDSIIFTNYPPYTNRWKGIKINASADHHTIISYSKIEYSNGKAIEIYSTNPTLLNLLIENNNDVTPGLSPTVGGILIDQSSPILKNLLIRDCSGAIYIDKCTLKLENSTITNNYTSGVNISNFSNVEIINSIISNTISNASNGPGLNSQFSSIIIRNSIFKNNQNRGFIAGQQCNIKFINSLLINNGDIGIGFNTTMNDTYVDVINSIITGHAVNAISSAYSITHPASVSIKNSCFWNNGSSPFNFIPAIPYLALPVTTNNNGDSIDAYGNIFMDPMFLNAGNSDFSHDPNSPCIDAGHNASINFPGDYIGNARVFDGNGDNNAIVDMGPYEYNSLPINLSQSVIPGINNLVNIYPNPNNGQFTLQLPENYSNATTIEIYNTLGKIIFSSIENKKQITINVESLSEGMYFVKTKNKEETKVIRFVKTK